MAEKILSHFSSILNSLFPHIGYTCACAQIKSIGGVV